MLGISIEQKLRNLIKSKSHKRHKLMRRFLREYKVDLNKLHNLDVLYYSIRNNDIKMFKLLREYGAVINMDMKTIYIYGCIDNKNMEFLEYIIKNIEINFYCVEAILSHEYIINKLGGKETIINYVKSFPQLVEQYSNYDQYFKL
jgi:hypothetical protein